MSKRRYNAKKIAQTPSLKRNLAMIVAEYAPRDPQLSLTNLLAYGHRGYISYSEDELCKLFDKIHVETSEKLLSSKKELEDKMNKSSNASWQISSIEREIKIIDAHLAKFKVIADQIFEKKVLL